MRPKQEKLQDRGFNWSRVFRRFGRWVAGIPWLLIPLTLIVFIFLTWLGLWLFEPESNAAIYDPWNIWYFYMVTATTIGYGDFSPKSVGGYVTVAIFAVMGGIGIVGLSIGKITEWIINFSTRRKRGLADYRNLQEHIVIVGWSQMRTPRIIKMLVSDYPNTTIALVCCNLQDNPMPESIKFIRGEELADVALYRRVNISKASRIMICMDSDDDTIAAALAIDTLIHYLDCHVVIHVNNPKAVETVKRAMSHAEVIPSVTPGLLTRSLCDPGSSLIIEDLLNNIDGGNSTYSFDLDMKDRRTDWRRVFGFLRTEKALGIGYYERGRMRINPEEDEVISHSVRVYYIAPARIDDATFNRAVLMVSERVNNRDYVEL